MLCFEEISKTKKKKFKKKQVSCTQRKYVEAQNGNVATINSCCNSFKYVRGPPHSGKSVNIAAIMKAK